MNALQSITQLKTHVSTDGHNISLPSQLTRGPGKLYLVKSTIRKNILLSFLFLNDNIVVLVRQ